LENAGAVYDVGEFEDLFDLYGDRPLLRSKAPEGKSETKINGKANGTGGSSEWTGPVDTEARLAAMRYGGAEGTSVNDKQKSVIPALLWRGMHPDEVIVQVTNATMQMAQREGLNWSHEEEIKAVTARCLSGLNLLQKDYDASTGEIPRWLAGMDGGAETR